LDDRLLPSELGRQRLGMLGYVQPPPPLSWRERLRILRDAARGLVYLHMPSADGSKPVVLHRDVKPQNILLTEQLGVRLADFGLAKQHEAYMAADDARLPLSTVCAIKGTPGFLDPLATNSAGHVSEVNDGFAMGITILVALTGLPATDIQPRCRQLLRNPGRPDKWVAPGRPDATAGEWPDAVATGLADVVVGLAMEQFKEDRLPLPDALAALEALAQSFGVDEAASRAPLLAEERAARQPLAECLICLDAPREMRLGCGHAICCERCLPQLSECPTCRQTIIRGEAKRLGGAMLSTATAASAIATFEMVVPNATHRAQAFGAMRAAAEQTRRDEVEHVAAPISLSGRGGRGGRGTGRGRARVG
jgi:serine/threonine protein kinase